MDNKDLNVDNLTTRVYHKVRPSYLNSSRHYNDNYTNLGYDYRGNMLKNTVSKEMWSNPQQNSLIIRIDMMMTFLLEQSKMVKKWFSIAVDKNDTNIN